jgi:uncharacterized RDD family membrane protein YckC
MFNAPQPVPSGPAPEPTEPLQEKWLPPGCVPAGFGWRVLASEIDCVVCGLIFGTIFIMLRAVFPLASVFTHATGPAVMLTLPFVYAAWAESSRQGATIGKRLLRMKVHRVNGDRVSLLRALVRQVLKLATFLAFPIAFLWIAWPTKKQGLHDLAVQTMVVRRRVASGPASLSPLAPTAMQSRLDVLATAAVLVLSVAALVGVLYWVAFTLLKGFAMQGLPASY